MLESIELLLCLRFEARMGSLLKIDWVIELLAHRLICNQNIIICLSLSLRRVGRVVQGAVADYFHWILTVYPAVAQRTVVHAEIIYEVHLILANLTRGYHLREDLFCTFRLGHRLVLAPSSFFGSQHEVPYLCIALFSNSRGHLPDLFHLVLALLLKERGIIVVLRWILRHDTEVYWMTPSREHADVIDICIVVGEAFVLVYHRLVHLSLGKRKRFPWATIWTQKSRVILARIGSWCWISLVQVLLPAVNSCLATVVRPLDWKSLLLAWSSTTCDRSMEIFLLQIYERIANTRTSLSGTIYSDLLGILLCAR